MPKKKTPAGLQWHPYAESYPLMKGKAYEELREDIKDHGVTDPAKFRIKNRQRQFLDGRNRARVCEELGIKLPTKQVSVSDEDVENWIDSHNLHRRHLTPEEQEIKRKERIDRVSERRAAGESTRAIAEAEGISQGQVRRDLAAGESPDSPDDNESSKPAQNGTVTGTDGKTYPAGGRRQVIIDALKPEAPAVLCSGCQRKGYRRGCLDCEAINKKSKGKKAKAGTKPTETKDGTEIPERLQQYFASAEAFANASRLAIRLANIFQEIEKTPAYLKIVTGKRHREHSTYIRTAGLEIDAITPVRPCPDCGGAHEPSEDSEPCKACEGRGYQTKDEIGAPA
jgi:hypothetical protein